MLLRASASAFCRARSREYRAILTHPAVAESRQRSQWDRPTLGFVNFCPGSLSAAAAEWESQLTTAMHETLHALGFVSASWAYFREDDGTTPRTPRDESGEPVGPMQNGDSVIFFNFRADRGREMTYALMGDEDWDGFHRTRRVEDLKYCSLTEYDEAWNLPFAFSAPEVTEMMFKNLM